MSIEALNWAFNLPLDSASDKAVLIALANHATPDGRCWPSIRRVSLYTSLTDRAVRLALRRLEDAGLIRTTEREGTSNLYDLALPDGGRNLVPGGRNDVQGGEEPRSSKPKRTITNPTQERAPLPPDWWPPVDQIDWARTSFPAIAKEIEHETHKFVAHSEETGRTHARPLAAWRRWISNAAIYAARSNLRTGPGAGRRDPASLSQRNADTVSRVLGDLAGREDVVEPDIQPARRAGGSA